MNHCRILLTAAVVLLLTLSAVASVQLPGTSTLRVVSAAPNGEVAGLADANEIRVVFSEPMVELGRIPSPVTAPFFRIQPQVAGTFRWSGTTVLVFTPDPKRPLPLATGYRVTIDTAAKAVSGRALPSAFTFSFTTPTARLLRPAWYRRDGRIDAPILVTLRFNQPVRPEDVAAHLTARFQKHPWSPPAASPEAQAHARAVDPKATDRFNAKVAATAAAASADGPVEFRPAADWNKKIFPPSPDLVVLEAVTPIPPDSWVRLVLDEKLPSPAGPATPGRIQEYTVQAEAAFFADTFRCVVQCDPEAFNPLRLRRPVEVTDVAAATTVADITTPGRDQAVAKAKTATPRRGRDVDSTPSPTLEDAGFDAQPPAKTYAVTLDANLHSADGQTLGYTWVGIVENWHRSAFTSFGNGHGVWENTGGPVLPFYARNLQDVKQWTRRVDPSELMPTLLNLQANHFTIAPAGEGRTRALPLTVDKIQSHGLDMSDAIGRAATGLVWVAVEEGREVPRARRAYGDAKRPLTRATLVQATNLGISVKDSPQNTLIFVTRLDNAAPVAGARVSIVRLDNSTFWTGTTGADGVAVAPQTPLRDEREWMKLAFIVTAEKDGDVAYVGSDWNEGVTAWSFGLPFDLVESSSLLRGSVFSDRGVYRLGEEVHLKAILRANTPTGVRPLPAGTAVSVAVRDGEDRLVDRRSVTTGKWSSAEWTLQLPSDGSLGDYSVRAYLEADRRKDTARPGMPRLGREGEQAGDQAVPYEKLVSGSFLVAAYRRPDFRVDVKLESPSAIAGSTLAGAVSARYLFGAPTGGRPVSWTFSRSPIFTAPAAVLERFPAERWAFVGWSDEEQRGSQQLRREETVLPKTGDLALELKTALDTGLPYAYVLEADVEDVSRQHIANRAQVTVHPASWYIGLRRPSSYLRCSRRPA